MDRVPETRQLTEFKGREKIILERIWKELAVRINDLIDRIQPNHLEIIKPGNRVNEDGNFRFEINSNGNLIGQFKVSGTWTTVETTEGP